MIFYKTPIRNISLSKNGDVKNTKTNKILKVSKRGYFIYPDQPVNLPKLMLSVFKGIKIRTGQILFLDGNTQNYSLDNLEYKTKLQRIQRPCENDIKEIIKYYYGKDEIINIKDVYKYRIQLKIILVKRNFFYRNKEVFNIQVFEDYFSIFMPGFLQLSKRNNITVNDAERTIYFFLNKLIDDCKSDKIIKQ